MVKYVALDDGHGMSTAGKRTPFIAEIGRFIHENEFNREVVKIVNAELKRLGFKTLLTAPTDADTGLNARVALANRENVDLFVSFHYNAMTGNFATSKAQGFSVHIDPNASAQSVRFAQLVQKHLRAGTQQTDRGIVKQNLAVTRMTKMPAALIEFGFMDNKREALLMQDKNFQKECAIEVTKAICEFFGVAYETVKPASAPKPVKVDKYPVPTNADTNKGIGLVRILTDKLDVYDKPTYSGKFLSELPAGGLYYAYGQEGKWFSVGNGWCYGGSKMEHVIFYPHEKKTEPVKPAAKPIVVPSGTFHTVVKGDTLYSLSIRYKTSVENIQKLNGMGKSTTLILGEKLRVK